MIEDFEIKRLELFNNNLVVKKSAGNQMKKAVKRSKESKEAKINMQCLKPESASSGMKSVQNIVESKSVKGDGFVRRVSNINATKRISEVYRKKARTRPQSLEKPNTTKRQLKMDDFFRKGSAAKRIGDQRKNAVDCKQRKHGPTSAENRDAAEQVAKTLKQSKTTAQYPKKNSVIAKLSAAKKCDGLDDKEK